MKIIDFLVDVMNGFGELISTDPFTFGLLLLLFALLTMMMALMLLMLGK